MICRFNLKSVMLFSLLCVFSQLSNARNPQPAGPTLSKEDKTYIGLGAHFNRFKSIELVMVEIDSNRNELGTLSKEFPLTAHTTSASLVLGTYITDHIKTEVRFGQGVGADTLGGALELNIGQWFNWYMGAAYPITDYATIYAQYGLSIYNAEVTRFAIETRTEGSPTNPPRDVIASPSRIQMEEELFGEHFSTSWLVGVDFSIIGDWYWSFEYGRLLNDADTGIKVYQLNSLIKYEF